MTIISVVIILFVFLAPSIFNQALNVFLDKDESLSYYKYSSDAQAHSLGNLIVQFISTIFAFFVLKTAVRNKDKHHYYDDFVFICTIFILILRIIPDIGMTSRFVCYFGPILLVCNSKILQMDKTKISFLYVGYSLLFAIYYMVRHVSTWEAWEAISNYKSILF